MPPPLLSSQPFLIDTHTHFDVPFYDARRAEFAARAYANGVRHIVLIGYKSAYFKRMLAAQNASAPLICHLAMGLHPLYINDHQDSDLVLLDDYLQKYRNIAIAEIGLDGFTPELKAQIPRQKRFFAAQIELAKAHKLPIMLHIRKNHADALAMLKAHNWQGGGIAHSFSGGAQEAVAFVKMGFKLGITGQFTNPNAKKLRQAVARVWQEFGAAAFVLETDCPDMTPFARYPATNEPAFLPDILNELARTLGVNKEALAAQLWENSENAIGMTFAR